MRRHTSENGRRAILAAVAVLASASGCTLKEQAIPELSGPAELGIAFQMTANPDVLTANGVSTSAIQVRVRDNNGQPLSGQGVFFALADGSGNFADIGKLSSSTAVSDGAGIAQVIYTSPPRTDATAHRLIEIGARPISGDAAGQIYRTVRIELRSAEPRLFPQIPGNVEPICNFVMEPATGIVARNQDLLAQSTSSDPDGVLVRYEWDFGDGSTEDKPDVVHRYGVSGEYTLTHVVTDNGGIQAACAAAVFVE